MNNTNWCNEFDYLLHFNISIKKKSLVINFCLKAKHDLRDNKPFYFLYEYLFKII